jgi:hypothetical protein
MVLQMFTQYRFKFINILIVVHSQALQIDTTNILLYFSNERGETREMISECL